ATQPARSPDWQDAADLPFEPLPQFRQNALEDSAERADCRGKRIGIFIVTYNAVTTLNKVLRRITPHVWRNVEQVVVADDASQDATFELAVGIQALRNLSKLKVLKHPRNLGYGGNQKAGYRYFIEQGFDIVVLLHGDGQYAPELLSHMYAPLVRGEADAVFGSRMMKDYGGPLKGGMPFYKYLGNRVLTVFENRALGLGLTEFHSGYRAYNLHALSQIRFDKMTDDFHFDTEIIIKLHHQGFRISEVPIPTFYGDEICYVNGMKYARACFRAVSRYISTKRSVRSYPEYEEYFVPYKVKQSRYSSHYYARRLVGTNQRVLEAGCGDGSFGAELALAGNRVIGLDPQPQASERAGYEVILEGALDQQILGHQPLQRASFDRVLLLDQIDRFPEPKNILRELRPLLAERGKLIVSVPNAVNITTRLMVLFGRFQYSDRGIMDWSHLRFFTRSSIRNLLESEGLHVIGRHSTLVPLERLIALPPDHGLLRAGNILLKALTTLAPGLLAYQVILVAEKR
ncbi:MAG TPA: bifunctional glycosyltransferase/class I SAM-dependent methyltransferase, partial [Bryobacteraceae bacterium]|nr:bifunctional glycosyltransferase/class I SAM-dependent methyltransferase [Bryobacteraceae bacterium]